MWFRSLSAVLVATAVLTGLASVSSGASTPARIKIPKVTSYPASVDVAGYVDFNWTWDNHQPCVPGYLKTVSEELSFESSKPRRSVISIIDGKVTMPVATGGQAKVKADLKQYETSNYCKPTAPVPEPPEPVCKTLTGKLGVMLSPEKLTAEEDELFPLAGAGVLISFTRKSKTRQTYSCADNRPTPRAILAPQGVFVDTMLVPYGYLAVPLKSRSMLFSHLKRGGRLANKIRVNGRCDRIAAHASSLPEGIKSCTVHGRIVVTIKRLR